MNLLPNEIDIDITNNSGIGLTNYRIYKIDKDLWGNSQMISIFLEDISSIEVKYKNYIILLILAVIVVLYGFFESHGDLLYSLGLAGLLVLIWFVTRKHVISIASNGGAVRDNLIAGIGKDSISKFIDQVSLAKFNRVNDLHKII